jgi:hypothetical protein
MSAPQADSMLATDSGESVDFQPPAFALRMKGLSERVFFVSTQFAL